MRIVPALLLLLLCNHVNAQLSPSARIDELTGAIASAPSPERKAQLLLQRSRMRAAQDIHAATADAQEALSLYQESANSEGQVDAYINLSSIYFRQNKRALCFDLDSVSYALSRKIGYLKGEAQAVNNLSRDYQSMGNLKKAKEYLLKAEQIYEREGMTRDLAEVYNRLGSVTNRLNDYKASLEYFDKGLEIAKEKRLDVTIANIYMNKADLMRNMKQSEAAINLYLESLKINERLRNTMGIAITYNNLGSLYSRSGARSTALEQFRQAASYCARTPNKELLAGIYTNMAGVFVHQGNEDSITYYYGRAHEMFTTLDNPRGASAALFGLGQYYVSHKQVARGLSFYEKALALRRKAESPGMVASTLNAIASAYTKEGQHEKAFGYLQEALGLAENGRPQDKASIYRNLAEHYKSTGATDEALHYQSQYIAATDTLVREDAVADMLKAQQRYEIEKRENLLAIQKKENEINRLQLDNRKQTILLLVLSLVLLTMLSVFLFYRYRNFQQVRTERLRKRLSRDLHDDIGSTLSSINIYSELAKSDDGRVQYLDAIKGHTQSVLTSLDDLVWSLQPKNDSMGFLADRMRMFSLPLLEAKGIQPVFSFDADASTPVSIEHRTHLYLAFKEMINNVVKHSGATSCTVHCEQKGKEFSISVKDNGRGFVENEITARRNGLGNLRARAAEGGGSFALHSAPGEGTSMRFTIQLITHKYGRKKLT